MSEKIINSNTNSDTISDNNFRKLSRAHLKQHLKDTLPHINTTYRIRSTASDPHPVWPRHVAFLDQLINARHRRNLSQAELGELTGMKQTAIARIESGRGNPTLLTLLAIAEALGTKLEL